MRVTGSPGSAMVWGQHNRHPHPPAHPSPGMGLAAADNERGGGRKGVLSPPQSTGTPPPRPQRWGAPLLGHTAPTPGTLRAPMKKWGRRRDGGVRASLGHAAPWGWAGQDPPPPPPPPPVPLSRGHPEELVREQCTQSNTVPALALEEVRWRRKRRRRRKRTAQRSSRKEQ